MKRDGASARASRLPFGALAVAVVAAAAFAGFLGWTHATAVRSPLDRFEAQLADIRLLLLGPLPAPRSVVVVAIDDETVAAEGGYPLDRRRVGDLVRAIGAAGATALAVDLLFVDATTPEADASLAAALATLPTVIAAAGRFDRTGDSVSVVPRTEDELWPLPPFEAAASAGLVNLSTDMGGTPRHMPLVFRTSRGPSPAFVLKAAGLAQGEDPVIGAGGLRLADRTLPLDLGWHLPIRFYGGARTIETVSALDLLGPAPPTGRLEGRVALLGVTATAVGDTFGTPFDPVTPGVEVLATGVANLLDGPVLVRDGTVRRIDAGAALCLAVGGVLLVALLPLAPALALVAAMLLAWLGATLFLFGHGVWLSGAVPLAATLLPVGLTALARQVHERREARALAGAEASLLRFQPPAIAERVARDPDFLRVPALREVAILFVDLAGFTGRSEELGPSGTQDFLKAFHTIVVEETGEHDGVVMNFMGDGAMVVFGVPDARPRDASDGLEAGFALMARVRRWLLVADPGGSLDVRAGVHLGPVMLSRLGHEVHQQITVSGDSVNVASRLLEVAKAAGASFAASQVLLDRAGTAKAGLGEPFQRKAVDIRGRREPLTVALWKPDPGWRSAAFTDERTMTG